MTRVDRGVVLYEVDGPIARIILNRPEKANAQSSDMVWQVDWIVTALATFAVALLAAAGVTLPRWWMWKLAGAVVAVGLLVGIATALFVKQRIVWLPRTSKPPSFTPSTRSKAPGFWPAPRTCNRPGCGRGWRT